MDEELFSRLIGLDAKRLVELTRRVATRLVQYYREVLDNHTQTGVYFSVRSRTDGEELFRFEVVPEGQPRLNAMEVMSYSWLAGRKTKTVYLRCLRSSRQVRDPTRYLWTGAVDTDLSNVILGLSGYTEDGDEALVIIVALEMGLMSEDFARTLATDIGDGNKIFLNFWEVWKAEKATAAEA